MTQNKNANSHDAGSCLHCKKGSRDVTNQVLPEPGIIYLFPARESLVSNIPPEDGKSIIFFNSVVVTTKCSVHCSEMEKYNQVVADILGQEVNEETFRQTICTIHPCTLLYNFSLYITTCTIPPSTIPSHTIPLLFNTTCTISHCTLSPVQFLTVQYCLYNSSLYNTAMYNSSLYNTACTIHPCTLLYNFSLYITTCTIPPSTIPPCTTPPCTIPPCKYHPVLYNTVKCQFVPDWCVPDRIFLDIASLGQSVPWIEIKQ